MFISIFICSPLCLVASFSLSLVLCLLPLTLTGDSSALSHSLSLDSDQGPRAVTSPTLKKWRVAPSTVQCKQKLLKTKAATKPRDAFSYVQVLHTVCKHARCMLHTPELCERTHDIHFMFPVFSQRFGNRIQGRDEASEPATPLCNSLNSMSCSASLRSTYCLRSKGWWL